MFGKKRCGGQKIFGIPLGWMLVILGAGILLGYIMPYYLLIIIFGIALIVAGIFVIRKK